MNNKTGSPEGNKSVEYEEIDEMLPEYDFDYRKARPNRFAEQFETSEISVTLDPDVAKVFTTSEAVNRALRTFLEAIPQDFTLVHKTQEA